MDFKLSKEHEMARKMFREFAENELEPLAVEIDEEERFPWENVEKFARYGMMGINIPKKYEGAGGDKTVKRQPVVKKIKVGPNDPCPCGSGKKYKKCCRDKDLAAERGQNAN